MADSTTNLDLLNDQQGNNVITANALFDAIPQGFGRRASTTSALTWGYYGGIINQTGSPIGLIRVPNGTVVLDPSDTNYVELDPDTGVVSVNQVGFSGGSVALYAVITNATAVVSYADWRISGVVASAAAGSSSPLTTKGDLYTRGVLVDTRLGVGTNGQILSANSAMGTGLEWISISAAPADPSYLTLGTNATLTSERVLTAGAGISFNDAGAGGALTVSTAGAIAGQSVTLTPESTPSAPASGTRIFLAQDYRLAHIDDASFLQALMGSIGDKRVVWSTTLAGTAGVSEQGLSSVSVGNASGITQTGTNLYTMSSKMRLTATSAAANINAARLFSSFQVFRGNAAGLGGFMMTFVVGFNLLNADSRMFIGVKTSAVQFSASVDPSTVVNTFGVGWDAADTNMQFMHNDNAGSATKTDLGANFPRPTVDVSIYHVRVWCLPNASDMFLRVQLMNDKTKVDQRSANSNLPVNTTLLEGVMHSNTGPTAGPAVALDHFRFYGEATL